MLPDPRRYLEVIRERLEQIRMATVVDNRIGTDPNPLIPTAPPDADAEAVVLGRLLRISGQDLGDLVGQLDAGSVFSQVASQSVDDSLAPALGDVGAVTPE